MKTTSLSLVGLLLSLGCAAQIPGPVPPFQGTWHDVRQAQLRRKLQQNPPMPDGGFWVIEEKPDSTKLAIVRFYTPDGHEIHADTLKRNRLNIHNRAVVVRLHAQLREKIGGRSYGLMVSHTGKP